MRIVVALVIAVPMILILSVAVNAPGPLVKNYRFPHVEIGASVRPDGALAIDERRSFAFFTIDWPLHLIQDFSISENGQL